MQILVMKIDIVPHYSLLLGSFKTCNSIQNFLQYKLIFYIIRVAMDMS